MVFSLSDMCGRCGLFSLPEVVWQCGLFSLPEVVWQVWSVTSSVSSRRVASVVWTDRAGKEKSDLQEGGRLEIVGQAGDSQGYHPW